ncbi:MAG TPA: Spy/CpxP family protein refolding chaperone [Gemmatimonadales bacterium]|nr:Spy/CpxP family protein refolding chaperone [Gemmatimonadales bacterium]
MNLRMRALALTALLAVPAGLTAQQPATVPDSGRGMMMRHHGMMGMGPAMPDMMMMGNMEYSPEHLLALNGELSLTAQQIMALTALRDQAKKSRDGTMDKIKTHMDELHTALDAAMPDTTAIRTHFLAAHDAMGQAHLAMLITNARAKAILTDAQRTQLSQMHRMGMMNHRGPGRAGPDGPAVWRGRPAMRVF